MTRPRYTAATRCFVDTNVVLYAVDPRDEHKQHAAALLIEHLARERNAVTSTQVHQEFSHNALRKLAMPADAVKATLRELAWMDLVTVQREMIEQAVDLTVTDRLSFWDALILTAAASARCSVLYSEDLNAGQAIRGVRVVNPFAERPADLP